MTHIQLQNVTVVLQSGQAGGPVEVRALDDVTLTVRSGEAMGVIGPTGSGKSTLLRVVAGLIQPDSGRVLYNGEDQSNVPPRERGIGMVFQDFALAPHWNVRQNVSFYLRLRKRDAELPDKIREAAQILGVDLQALLGRMPSNLSVGQRQQVSIARCLIRDPRIFLMDEPFAHLDAVQRQGARLQLKRLLSRFKVTTLYVTHDQVEAAGLCDRVAIMGEGRIWQVDTYRNLLRWPASLDVAQFVAEPGAQFVEGACLDGHFVRGTLQVPLSPAVRVRARPGQALVLRIQPAAVSLASEEKSSADVVEAVAEWIEPLPLQRLQRVTCRTEGVALALELPQETAVHVGDRLRLSVDPERVEVFAADTGRNMSFSAAP